MLIAITRLMVMIQLKLLTWLHFVVDAFVWTSFRELIPMSWKPVRKAASCTVTWACQRNSLSGWTHVRCAVGEFLRIWWLNWLLCWNWLWNSLRYCLTLSLWTEASCLPFSDLDFVKYSSGSDSERLDWLHTCSTAKETQKTDWAGFF